MPRAHRHFLPGHAWHLTHRCHRRQFLLKFARDRRRWLHWLFEARRRFDLCVLNYTVTSNHVHLLVLDRGEGEIARSMQLIAGRTAQEYNRRKSRKGAYWEDRYHATAVESDSHLARCLVYIDLNMVRAGAVSHPRQWQECGYREIQDPPTRYQIIDRRALAKVLGLPSPAALPGAHCDWVESALVDQDLAREAHWSESLAVGSRSFVSGIHEKLGDRALGRAILDCGDASALRDDAGPYTGHLSTEIAPLSVEIHENPEGSF